MIESTEIKTTAKLKKWVGILNDYGVDYIIEFPKLQLDYEHPLLVPSKLWLEEEDYDNLIDERDKQRRSHWFVPSTWRDFSYPV